MRKQLYVTKRLFSQTVHTIAKKRFKAVDTETTGLNPFHGDRLFSVQVSTEGYDYYFNFNEAHDIPENMILPREWILRLQPIFNSGTVFMHNAKFDMHMLYGIDFKCRIWCCKAQERLLYNEWFSYKLADISIAHKLPVSKSDGAMDWIKKNQAYTPLSKAYKSWRQPRFDLVPFKIISEYGMRDSAATFSLGEHQLKRNLADIRSKGGSYDVMENELKLTKTLYAMEKTGVLCDLDYTANALEHSQTIIASKIEEFCKLSGASEFTDSAKALEPLFEKTDKERFVYTDKDNPSFEKEILGTFQSPLSQIVLDIRKAKSNESFFKQFLFSADEKGVIHTAFDPAGARTGRQSSSAPNLQNLSKDKDPERTDFQVRRCFVPRPGHRFFMLDYDQMEYKLLLDFAGAKPLIEKVLSGLDVHQAIADLAHISRDTAKTVNFGTIYGQGLSALAASLGVSEKEAEEIQAALYKSAPEIGSFIEKVKHTAANHRKMKNWFGRTYHFPKKWMSYKAPNTLIQGGGADIVKIAMNRCAEFLEDLGSNLILTVHDELVFEVPIGEEHVIRTLKDIMVNAYPHRHLPLSCSVESSLLSLGNKQPWNYT